MSATPDSTLANPEQRIADLECQLAEFRAERDEAQRQLAERTIEVDEALAQQTATAEILRVISGSPTDLQPTLDAIAASAAILTGAANGVVSRFDGSLIHFAAQYGWTAEELEVVLRDFPRPPGPESTTGRAVLTREIVHLPDAAAEVDPVCETAGAAS